MHTYGIIQSYFQMKVAGKEVDMMMTITSDNYELEKKDLLHG